MNEQTKSVIRHALTGLGILLMALGLGKWSGLINYVLENLDPVFSAISVIGGVAVTIYGYFKGRPPATNTGSNP